MESIKKKTNPQEEEEKYDYDMASRSTKSSSIHLAAGMDGKAQNLVLKEAGHYEKNQNQRWEKFANQAMYGSIGAGGTAAVTLSVYTILKLCGVKTGIKCLSGALGGVVLGAAIIVGSAVKMHKSIEMAKSFEGDMESLNKQMDLMKTESKNSKEPSEYERLCFNAFKECFNANKKQVNIMQPQKEDFKQAFDTYNRHIIELHKWVEIHEKMTKLSENPEHYTDFSFLNDHKANDTNKWFAKKFKKLKKCEDSDSDKEELVDDIKEKYRGLADIAKIKADAEGELV